MARRPANGPTNPFREARRPGASLGPANLNDLDDVSTFISEIEADQKGVPILYKPFELTQLATQIEAML